MSLSRSGCLHQEVVLCKYFCTFRFFFCLSGLSGDVRWNTQIGFIKCWGPLFRVSVDLFVKSYAPKGKYASVLEFNRYRRYRTTAIFLKDNGDLHIANSVSGKLNHYLNHWVGANKWRNIVLEQTEINGKVRKKKTKKRKK